VEFILCDACAGIWFVNEAREPVVEEPPAAAAPPKAAKLQEQIDILVAGMAAMQLSLKTLLEHSNLK
jgi:hypothetical protein